MSLDRPPDPEPVQSPAPAAALGPLIDWLLSRATAADDPHGLAEGLGRALVAMGIPVERISVAAPTLDPLHRGLSVAWRRGRGSETWATAHDEAGEAEFRRSPIAALLAEGGERARWRLEAGEGRDRFPLLAELGARGHTDYRLALVGFAPGTAMAGIAISYTTKRPGGFDEAEAAVFEALVPALGLAFYRLNLGRTLRHLLGAYVGPRTAERILSGRVRRAEGELIAAAILLVDLRSFTRFADHEDPLRVVAWLDQHLDALGAGVAPSGGEILKFTGDGFLAVFPVEDRDARPCEVCGRALAALKAGHAANRALEPLRRAAGEPWLAADLVLHYGDVVYGNIGTAERLDFTAIGRAVNEASRIEALCDRVGRNVLVSDSFARRCAETLVELGAFTLRGLETPRRLWTVADG